MEVKFFEEVELAKKSPAELITMLFAYRRRLLESARDDRSVREEIFRRREEIAGVFERFGSERHVESAQLFRGLAHVNDILAHSPPRKTNVSPNTTERAPLGSGFYFFLGKRPDNTKLAALWKMNGVPKRRQGSRTLTWIELFRVGEEGNDYRSIFITQEVDARLQNQLAVLISLRPDLAERLRFVQWDDAGEPIVSPYSAIMGEHSTALSMPPEVTERLREFVYHQPKVGELFMGRIVRIVDFCPFLEFLPGITGLVHSTELPSGPGHYQVGDEVVVQILGFVGFQNSHIRLSIRAAQQALREGRELVFEGSFAEATQLLLADKGKADDES